MMKRGVLILVTLALLIIMPIGQAMAQLRMKQMRQSGFPSKFIKAHPEYIYLNKPEEDYVTGFSYLISESLNPGGLGLNSSNYWIVLESFDHNEKPKALIWDGNFKQRLAKRMNTTSKKVVYFINDFILDKNNLLTFVGVDEKYKYSIKCALSANGTTYAKGKWQKHTFQGNFFSWVTPKVKVNLTHYPAYWLKNKLAVDKTHLNKCLQDPSTLAGTAGWFFDIQNDIGSDLIQKHKFTYDPVIELWKDEDHSIPLNFCKMAGTELTYHPDMDRDNADYNNVVHLDKEFPSLAHQYYYLDWTAMADASDVQDLPDGKVIFKAYYTVRYNVHDNNYIKGHAVYDMPAAGTIILEAQMVRENEKHKVKVSNRPPFIIGSYEKSEKFDIGPFVLQPGSEPNDNIDEESNNNPNNNSNDNTGERPGNNPNENTGGGLDNDSTQQPRFIIPDPRPLCPPHKYKIVSENDFSTKRVSENTSAPKSSLPATITYTLNKYNLELCREDAADGSVYYISTNPVNSDLWEYAMKSDNPYDLSDTFFYNDKCYNRVMDFFVKLNEKTRNQNIPFSFMLPSFEELKKYASNHYIQSYYPSFVDSIKICSNVGETLTLEQYMALKNKTGVFLLGGTLKDKELFESVSLNDSSKQIQIYLKAVPDNQQMKAKKTSITRIGMLKTVLKRCEKCGKTVSVYRRSKTQDIQQMIESVDDVYDDDDSYYSLCNNLIRLGDENLIRKRLAAKKWRVDKSDDKVVNYKSPDGKYGIEVKKEKKKDTNVKSVELMFKDTSSDEIFKAIKELGYKEIKRKLNVSTSNPHNDYSRYDWYGYSDNEGYIVFLSIFTEKNNKLSVYVIFSKSN